MKKSLYIAALTSLMGFAACQKEELTVINPDAEAGTLTFIMNTPDNADALYTIVEGEEDKELDTFTCEKPDFGFTASTTYSLQISLDKNFDEFKDLQGSNSTESMSAMTLDVNKAINQLHALGSYAPIEEPQEVYFRMKAVVSDATNSPLDPTPIVKPALSNGVKLMIQPYKMVLNPALPATYYLIGVDGKWGSAIGTDLIPMSTVEDYEYDEETGKGEFVYTGYFKEGDGFKVVGIPGSWDEQWGSADGTINNLVHNDGASQNITIGAAGFYQVTLNSVMNKMTIKLVEEIELPKFEYIKMIGDFNGWNDAADAQMTPHSSYNKYTVTSEMTLTADSGVKFRADGDWATSWGGKTFPFCTKPSGDNIPAKAGKYRVVFNVLDKCYLFFAIEEAAE